MIEYFRCPCRPCRLKGTNCCTSSLTMAPSKMWGSCWIALECPRGELIVSSGADGECDWAWNVVFVHRYGFVTFQNQEDAFKVLCDVSKSKMLGRPDLHLIVRSMRVYLVRRVSLFAHWLPFQKRQNPPEASLQFLKKVIIFLKNAYLNASRKLLL